MIDLDSLITQQAQRQKQPESQWRSAVMGAPFQKLILDFSDGQIEQLISASASPQHLELMSRLLLEAPDHVTHRVSSLLQHVDNSPFDLADWIGAFFELNHWLNHNKKSADFLSMLGYLSCCASAATQQGPTIKLALLTKQHLEQHGFERAKLRLVASS